MHTTHGAHRLIPVLAAAVGLAACRGDEKSGEVEESSGGLGIVDIDNDGIAADEDCDDRDPAVLGPTAWYSDGDNDGFGAADSETFLSCTRPTGASNNNLDCDDTRADTHPDAPEVCGGGDEDCDGLIDDDDDDVVGRRSAFADTDLDGFGDENAPVEVCDVGNGAETVVGDCDDTRPDVHPEADEICRNGIDDNCDGAADLCEWDENSSLQDSAQGWIASEGDFAGTALARAEDATGDGLPDLLVGMPYSDRHTYDGGAVAVLSGPSAVGGGRLADGQVDAFLLGTEQSGYAGRAVTAADFDGDGFSDVVMGAPEASAPIGASGVVSVFTGPVNGIIRATDAEANLVGTRTGDRAGRTLSATHDVTGDGVVDLIVGSGATSANVAPVAAWVVSNPHLEPDLGAAPGLDIDRQDRPRVHVVATADLNGDGVGELIVGAPDAGNAESPEGAVYIHLGPFSANRHLVNDADTTWTGSPAHSAGAAVLADHDLDGDGFADLVVGSPGAVSDSGEVTLLTEPLDGGSLRSVTSRWTGTPTSNAGSALSSIVVGGEQYLIVGGPGADIAELDGGSVWVIPALASGAVGLEAVAIARFDGSRTSLAGEAAGSSLLGAGDLDGDTYEDIAIGAPLNGEGGVAAGAVHVVLGQGM